MRVLISDIITKKDRYGPDYYWIVGVLQSGMKVIIMDIYYDLRDNINQHVEMLLSFMRSPYLEQMRGIHNSFFSPEKYYSVELIDELLSKEEVVPTIDKRTITLVGKFTNSYNIPKIWAPLIQQKSFHAFFNNPAALKTKDGTFLLSPFHLRRVVPVEEIPQEVIMVGSVRLQAWYQNL